jgi:hypothetical protein
MSGSDGNTDDTEMSEGSMSKIAWWLKDSQDYEKGLTSALEAEMDNVAAGKEPTLTELERSDMIAEINNEAERRKVYYEMIRRARAQQANAESVAEKAAGEKIVALQFLESNLDSVKAALNSVEVDHTNKMKMTEINNYFSSNYKGYGYVAAAVAVTAAILLLLLFLRNKFGFEVIIRPIETIVQWVGGLAIVWSLYDVSSRRTDKYEEYVFPWAPTVDTDLAKANATLKAPLIDISGIDLPGLCAGSYCCGPGTTWNDNKGCVVNGNFERYADGTTNRSSSSWAGKFDVSNLPIGLGSSSSGGNTSGDTSDKNAKGYNITEDRIITPANDSLNAATKTATTCATKTDYAGCAKGIGNCYWCSNAKDGAGGCYDANYPKTCPDYLDDGSCSRSDCTKPIVSGQQGKTSPSLSPAKAPATAPAPSFATAPAPSPGSINFANSDY